MFKPQQFLQISLPFYLQAILNKQTPRKQLFQLSHPKNLFNFIGQLFTLCESTIKESEPYEIYLKFIRQNLAINVQQKNNKNTTLQTYSNNNVGFFYACLEKLPNSIKKIYLQLYMMFVRLFEMKCIVGRKQVQEKQLKNVENCIANLYCSIKLELSFQNQYSRLQIKDYVELALELLLKNRIIDKFKESLKNINMQCQFPESIVQMIQKPTKQMENNFILQTHQIKNVSKDNIKKTFSEKQIFRNKTKKKKLLNNGKYTMQINSERNIMETPKKQNKQAPNYINSDYIECTPQYKNKYDVRNPETSKSPLKNSNKKTKINRYLVSPCSSKKTHYIKKNQDKKKKKHRTLYASRKGIFNNFQKRPNEAEYDMCKTNTQTSIHFDSAKKSSLIYAIRDDDLDDPNILAHQTPKPKSKRTRTLKIGTFNIHGNFQLGLE